MTNCGGSWVNTATDNNNCGACGVTCNNTCYESGCLANLSSGPIPTTAVATDSTYVYFTAGGASGAVLAAPKGGGTAITLASGLASPNAIADNNTGVYWTNQGTPPTSSTGGYSGGSVSAILRSASTKVLTVAAGQNSPTSIALTADYIFWSTQGSVPTNGTPSYLDGTIVRATLDGSPSSVTTIASGQVSPMAVTADATYVYWATGTTVGVSDSAILRAPLAGGAPMTIVAASGTGLISSIAVDSANVYWTNSSGIYQGAPAGGPPITLATGLDYPNSITLDKSSVFAATRDANQSVVQIPIGGGTMNTVVINAIPAGIALDSSDIYWGATRGGVMKGPK